MKNSELKKLLKEVTTNKIVLYALSIVAFINLLSYLQYKCLGGIIVFLFIGMLTSHFTKNMILILSAAILLTNILVGAYSLCRIGLRREGFKEGEKDKKGKEHKKHKKDDDKDDRSVKLDKNAPKPDSDTVDVKQTIKLSATESSIPLTSQEKRESTKIANLEDDEEDDQEDDEEDEKESDSKSGFSNYKLEDAEEFSSNPNSLENVKMMKDVQSQLKELVGGNGLQNLDTAELLKQQKDLMKAIKQMQPLIDGATGMMDKIQGFNLGFGGNKN
tara:strand:+ start:230 stop:1051 length:822 start_codon:yes stop_codon:yes gene_type:complete